MIEIIPVPGIPEVKPSDDVAALIAARCNLRDADIVVVTQKIVSKAEGQIVAIDPANAVAERARLVEKEMVRVVARRGDIVVVETKHGLVCAHAGIDNSNVAQGYLTLLPEDSDASARRIRDELQRQTGAHVAVIVSDTLGRPWRTGQINVAIGVAGMNPVRSYIGDKDAHGNLLQATEIAVADEIASAAELVMGKTDQIPVAIVRGVRFDGDGTAKQLIRDSGSDLFRTGEITD